MDDVDGGSVSLFALVLPPVVQSFLQSQLIVSAEVTGISTLPTFLSSIPEVLGWRHSHRDS
jgi:hypothetical protein